MFEMFLLYPSLVRTMSLKPNLGTSIPERRPRRMS